MKGSTLSLVAASFKRFNGDKCWTSSIVISYFALLCCVPLIALFFTIAGRFLGNTEMALRSLNIFTDEFFAKLDPSFFKGLGDLSTPGLQLGLFGVVGSFISASFLFSSLITTINQIFRTKYHRSFFYNRLIEFLMMAVVGIFMFFSLAMTAVWTAFGRTLQKSELVRATLNPEAVAVINNVLLIYVIPYASDLSDVLHPLQVHPGDQGPHPGGDHPGRASPPCSSSSSSGPSPSTSPTSPRSASS